ncbi:hypothetical protein BKA69DRAFT_1094205 [Paraphysoderma sedebokerense]|nr:hypothetical protein BKA69DRAFT_1094205 [Paraphysoderma sedebokerense]
MNVTLNKSTQLSSNATTSLRPSSHSSSLLKHPLKANQPSRSNASTSQPKSGPNILHLHKHLNTLNSSLSSAQQSYERHKSKDPITANKFLSKVNKLMTEIKHTEAIIGREEKKKKGAREREKWLEF